MREFVTVAIIRSYAWSPPLAHHTRMLLLSLTTSQRFDMKVADAARSLGIGITCLKSFQKKFGIERWPHRKRQSVHALMEKVRRNCRADSQGETEYVLGELR